MVGIKNKKQKKSIKITLWTVFVLFVVTIITMLTIFIVILPKKETFVCDHCGNNVYDYMHYDCVYGFDFILCTECHEEYSALKTTEEKSIFFSHCKAGR